MTNAAFVERATALQWNLTDDALGILHYVKAFDAAVAEVGPVVDYELEPAGESAFYAYILDETNEAVRTMFGALSGDGIVVVPPIQYHEDGRVSLSVFGPTAVIKDLVESMGGPVDARVEQVGGLAGITPADSRLTDRQREAVRAGLAVGYYEIPREGSQEDVAAAMGCAPSTAAEHLRKTEVTLVRSALRWE